MSLTVAVALRAAGFGLRPQGSNQTITSLAALAPAELPLQVAVQLLLGPAAHCATVAATPAVTVHRCHLHYGSLPGDPVQAVTVYAALVIANLTESDLKRTSQAMRHSGTGINEINFWRKLKRL